MPKRKQPPKQNPLIRSIEELISDYDRPKLVRALNEVNTHLGWQVLRAALMKEYLRTVAYQLDLCSKTGKQIEASYYAGSAQTMFDTANTLISQYVDILGKKIEAVSDVRPEE